ncbi:MAG: adenine phosphoribosyltransferase [Peptococcaceae bacterium]|nr:MAG: adenine phosphoribosyltransferase [Peptococcaceae bacterium]
MEIEVLKEKIRSIPDFPKKGILFRDITTLLQDGPLFSRVIDLLAEYCRQRKAETIVAIESRGFIFGGALADRLKVPFIPVRKEGKLPFKTEKVSYALEYGEACVEMHVDALGGSKRAVVVDDLLATGGTVAAAAELVERCGGEVSGIAVLIELVFLQGREKLRKYDVYSLIKYDD